MYRSDRGRLRINPGSVKVLVTSVEGDEDSHAHMIEGKVSFRGTELEFSGVAFGRIGGFNVRAEFTEPSREELKEMGLSAQQIEDLEVYTQRMIIEGNFDSSPEVAAHAHRFE